MTTGRINQVTVVFRTLFFRTEIQKKKVEEKKEKGLTPPPQKRVFQLSSRSFFPHDMIYPSSIPSSL
jgi:hypothetical protein